MAVTQRGVAGDPVRSDQVAWGAQELQAAALQLLLEGWRPVEPVPVLFALAGWDPQIQPRVQDWRAGQFAHTYSDLCAFGAGVVQKLADQGLLLLVLDGVDETPIEHRGVSVRMVRDPL